MITGVITFLLSLLAIVYGFGGGSNNNNQSNPKPDPSPSPTSSPIALNPPPGNGQNPPPGDPPKQVPSPILLPGLIGLGIAALRKRPSVKDEANP